MKILFCIKAMDVSGGGAERVLAEVASELAVRGHDVVLLSFDDEGGQSFYTLDPAIRRVRIGFGSSDGASKFFRLFRYMLVMRRAIQEIQPDVAVGFMHSMFIPLGIALLGTGTRVIASEHIVPQHYAMRPFQRALLRLTPYIVGTITCVSSQAKASFDTALRRKMVVAPNPITIPTLEAADTVAEGRSRKRVLAVGRLDDQKDHATLIHAFASLSDQFPDWDLRIVGEGNLRSELKTLIDALGLADRVELFGGTPAIGDEYAAAQLFAQPSRYESFGLTVAEALIARLPAIGFDDCIGVNDLILDDENGILAAGLGDRVSSLAGAMRRCMEDDALRRRLAAGRRPSLDQHRRGAVTDVWDRILADRHPV